MEKIKRIAVLAFDDHPIGNAYVQDSFFTNSFTKAINRGLDFLRRHDHVLILPASQLANFTEWDYKEIVPFSIIFEAGDYVLHGLWKL